MLIRPHLSLKWPFVKAMSSAGEELAGAVEMGGTDGKDGKEGKLWKEKKKVSNYGYCDWLATKTPGTGVDDAWDGKDGPTI